MKSVIFLSEVVLRMRALPVILWKYSMEIQNHSCSVNQMTFLLEIGICITEGMLGMPERQAHSMLIWRLVQIANVSGIVNVCTHIGLFTQAFLFIICPFLEKWHIQIYQQALILCGAWNLQLITAHSMTHTEFRPTLNFVSRNPITLSHWVF